MESARRGPRALFLASLAIQPALLLLPKVPAALVLRPLPMLVLAVHVARAVPLARSWLVVIALALGGAGDAAMTLRHGTETSTALLTGIGFFFAGHLGYSAAFLRERDPRPARAPHAAVFVVAALVASALLLPRLGPLALPVGAYAVALTATTALAALRRTTRPTVLLGAALFFLSDVIIGARLATPAVPIPILALILPTYYLGQYWIAVGWARDASTDHVRAPGI